MLGQIAKFCLSYIIILASAPSYQLNLDFQFLIRARQVMACNEDTTQVDSSSNATPNIIRVSYYTESSPQADELALSVSHFQCFATYPAWTPGAKTSEITKHLSLGKLEPQSVRSDGLSFRKGDTVRRQ